MLWTTGWLNMRRFNSRMSSEYREALLATPTDCHVATKRNRMAKRPMRKALLVVAMERMRVETTARARVEVGERRPGLRRSLEDVKPVLRHPPTSSRPTPRPNSLTSRRPRCLQTLSCWMVRPWHASRHSTPPNSD